LKLCAQGPSAVDWSSSWDKQSNSWLHLEENGHIQASGSQQLQVRASAALLTTGTYTVPVTFSTIHDGKKAVIVRMSVTLLVQGRSNHSCIRSNVQTLTFTSIAGQAAPAPQVATVSNCGNTGDWSASSTTTDGSNWLAISSVYGNLDSNASQKLTVSVSP